MITEAKDPYIKEYRLDMPMNTEKMAEATTRATEVKKAPRNTGARGLPGVRVSREMGKARMV